MTVVISSGRRSGKTRLIKRCAELGGYIVCADRKRATHIRNTAVGLGLSVPFPLTIGEVMRREYHGVNCAPFHFDDADDILRALVEGEPIATITLTSDDAPGRQ